MQYFETTECNNHVYHVYNYIIDSIVKELETAHVRPLKRVRTPRAILVTSCYELSQFRAPEKERTRKIKDEEDASSRSYEIFNNIITFWK